MELMKSETNIEQKPVHHSTGLARNLAAAEIMSFLKQTRAAVPWTERDLAKTLNIGMNEARQALVVMQFEGYVASVGGPGAERSIRISGSYRVRRKDIVSGFGALLIRNLIAEIGTMRGFLRTVRRLLFSSRAVMRLR
jgi:hypothetical protein